jgi:hypothetical protein
MFWIMCVLNVLIFKVFVILKYIKIIYFLIFLYQQIKKIQKYKNKLILSKLNFKFCLTRIWNAILNWWFESNAWDTIPDHFVLYLLDGVTMLTTIIPPHEQIIMFCVIVLIFSSFFPYEVACCFSSKDGVIVLI